MVMGVAIINASWRNSHPQMTRRFIPAHKENKHEAGCTKKFAQAQETKEAPCYEEVRGGEEIKGGGSVTIEINMLPRATGTWDFVTYRL